MKPGNKQVNMICWNPCHIMIMTHGFSQQLYLLPSDSIFSIISASLVTFCWKKVCGKWCCCLSRELPLDFVFYSGDISSAVFRHFYRKLILIQKSNAMCEYLDASYVLRVIWSPTQMQTIYYDRLFWTMTHTSLECSIWMFICVYNSCNILQPFHNPVVEVPVPRFIPIHH